MTTTAAAKLTTYHPTQTNHILQSPFNLLQLLLPLYSGLVQTLAQLAFHTVLKSNLIPSDKCRDSYRKGWFFDHIEANFSQPAVIPLFIQVPCSVSCWNSCLHSNYSIAAYTMPSPDPMFSDKCMLQAYQNIPN